MINSDLCQNGFTHIAASEMQALLLRAGLRDWEGFAGSWNDLGMDTYMADGGRYRRRRYAAFSVRDGMARRKPHQPHYQSRDYNKLNGGLERWFLPVLENIGAHPCMTALLKVADGIFTACTPAALRPSSWHVEVHQFRIEASGATAGRPTPEGMHQDGVDWVLVLLVRRENVARGETSVHDLQRVRLGSFTLTDPMEAALVDDGRVFHGVTPIVPVDASRPAYRDVLVATFRRE